MVRLNSIENQEINLHVLDVSNRRLFSEQFQLVKGENTIEVESGLAWPAGVYFVEINIGQEKIIARLIKM